MAGILIDLSSKIHPLVLGDIFRSREQIRRLSEKLLSEFDQKKKKTLIEFLCSESGSHDYTINRREAAQLGLPVEKPGDDGYKIIRAIYSDMGEEMGLSYPYNPMSIDGEYSIPRVIIESRRGGAHQFLSEGSVVKLQQQQAIQLPNGAAHTIIQTVAHDERRFEGWRKVT